jgi:hypothetical protein
VTIDFAGTELPDVLNRAINTGPISLTFASSDTARRWVFRAHNYIRRHDPSMRQLMIGRRENVVRIEVPQFTITEVTNADNLD